MNKIGLLAETVTHKRKFKGKLNIWNGVGEARMASKKEIAKRKSADMPQNFHMVTNLNIKNLTNYGWSCKI